MRQCGFSHAGKILYQQVAARQQAGERQINRLFLAQNDAVDLPDHAPQCGDGVLESGVGLGRHCRGSGFGPSEDALEKIFALHSSSRGDDDWK